MQDKSIILENKISTFQKVLIHEFIREFNFLADVAAGRANAKGDFTDKILKAVGIGLNTTVGVIPNPFLSGVVTNFINYALEIGNDHRKASKQETISNLHDEIVQDQLVILLEEVAREAARRYEFIIAAKLSDHLAQGVIRLAKTGVERMLEYIARTNLPLTVENLLQGLIEGRSGAYVTKFHNTGLEPKENLQEELTAEGVYARSGFRSFDQRYWVLKKENAIHKQPTSSSSFQKIKSKLKRPYDYGYSKYNKNGDPKYGYAWVPMGVIEKYGYQLHTPSEVMKSLLQDHPPSFVVVDQHFIRSYLNSLRNKPTDTNNNNTICLSLIDYVNTRCVGVKTVVIKASLRGLDLSGADFSNCDLTGIDLSECNLSNARFNGAILVHAKLTKINGKNAAFHRSQLQYAELNKSDFSDTDFTQANLSYSSLQDTDLSRIQQRGTIWIGTDLTKIRQNDKVNVSLVTQLSEQQQVQLHELRIKNQNQMKEITDTIHNQSIVLLELKQRLNSKTEQLDSKLQEQAVILSDALDQLAQEHQLRETFERHWRIELTSLQQQVTEIKTQDQQERILAIEKQLQNFQQEYQNLAEIIKDSSDLIDKITNQQLEYKKISREVNNLKFSIVDFSKDHQHKLNELADSLSTFQKEMDLQLQALRVKVNDQGDRIDKIAFRLQKLEVSEPTGDSKPMVSTTPFWTSGASVTNSYAKGVVSAFNFGNSTGVASVDRSSATHIITVSSATSVSPEVAQLLSKAFESTNKKDKKSGKEENMTFSQTR